MNTLFDKIWDAHVVQHVEGGPDQLYIDRLYCHEVTSPQAFDGLRARGIRCLRPEKIFCMPDHNTPTENQDKPITRTSPSRIRFPKSRWTLWRPIPPNSASRITG